MIEADKRKAIYLLAQEGMTGREISRRQGVSRTTVKVILDQQGAMPMIEREKQRIDEDLLKQLYEECNGYAQRVQEKLAEEEGIQVTYPTLTRMLRALGLSPDESDPTRSVVAAQQWLSELTFGAQPMGMGIFETQVDDRNSLGVLLHYFRNGRLRERKKAATILAGLRGIPNTIIAKCLHSARVTTRGYLRAYREDGPSALFGKQTRCSGIRNDDALRTRRILELLHQKPNSFGVNRTSWTQQALREVYGIRYDETLSRYAITRLIRDAGYAWKRARDVLTSPDPDYREKVARLLRTLRSLRADEMFFFLDEWGPIQVKKRGGKAYRSKAYPATVPRKQKSKGTVTLAGALSATTNQVTWFFEPSKDTRSMINLIEVLHNQHHTASRLYVTWDAVGWHSSTELTAWLDAFNEKSKQTSAGPVVELVPLPTSAQFLEALCMNLILAFSISVQSSFPSRRAL